MSVEVISWALNHAPVRSSSARFVLVGLANHADPEGKNAFPSIARLSRYTGLDERTVRRHLRDLEDAGVIVRGDPNVVAAHIPRPDRRPVVYDLAVDKWHDGGAVCPPDAGTGGHSRQNGGAMSAPRGGAVPPETSFNRQKNREPVYDLKQKLPPEELAKLADFGDDDPFAALGAS